MGKNVMCFIDEVQRLREKYPDVDDELYTVDLVKGELGLGENFYF